MTDWHHVTPALLDAIRDQYALDWHGIHGIGHWERVRDNGRRLAATTGAEVLRRHQVDPTTYYRWEKQAKAGMREALEGRRGRNGKAVEREIKRLRTELEKKRRTIAEVVEENLELKRGL